MNDSLTRKIDLIKLYEEHSCLIVDDLPEMRGAIKRMVANQGIARVDTAPNAAEAVTMCAARPYTIVICDYNLGPSQDGQQLLEVLRDKKLIKPTSIFVIITAETSREMVLGAIESQPDDYITKPFTPKQFCRRLDRLMIKHQALLPIKKLFAEKKFKEALVLCDDMIKREARFAFEAERLRGRILFLLGQLHKAREHYEQIIEQRPLPWAMLGLAETLVELGADDQAEKILQKVVQQDHRYVEAHDLLSRIYKSRNDYEQAQECTQTACELSPKSVRRQRALAQLAELNGDIETSVASHKQAIRWAQDSIHESGNDHLNFARKTAEQARLANGNLKKDKAEQALRQIRKAKETYPNKPDMNLQAALVSADVKQSFKMAGAQEEMEKARILFEQSMPEDVESHLDFVRMLQSAGNEQLAQEQLQKLAIEYANDNQILERIERLSSEPLTAGARTKVAKLTKAGITAYQDRNYSQASHIFKEALSLFPNHTGLNLNLVQVILERHEELLDQNDVILITRCFERVRNLPESDPQHARFKTLKLQFDSAERVQHQAS